MSRKEKLLTRNLVTLVRKDGGSFKKQADYTKIMERFGARLAALNIQIGSAQQLKVRHIELYIYSRLADSVSIRTLQNEMSAVRVMLRQAGKTIMADPKHERLSNKVLGISSSSRKGTKRSVTDERYQDILTRLEKADEGVAATVRLARYLGLRNEEAVQAVKSLSSWQKALQKGDKTLTVIFGTKGGRKRETTIVEREKVKEAVNLAAKYAREHGGKLIERDGLKASLNHYINTLRREGELTGGDETPHSFRYSYAEEAFKYHLSRGYSKEESLALTSMDLGHGDGRGTYIKNVYCQSLMD